MRMVISQSVRRNAVNALFARSDDNACHLK
jgi:hypothetical protein